MVMFIPVDGTTEDKLEMANKRKTF